MADNAASFSKLVPGFDFLQNLVKGAGAALPGIGQWVAPTLNPDELEKRIEELRTVQFWLEQNARMLGATIQALEVQRMTLSTLKTMNVQMGDLRDAMTLRQPEVPASKPAADAAPARKTASRKTAAATPAVPPPGVVDPMQWWGALTQQFSDLAAAAVKDTATDAARNLAGAMVKQSIDAAGDKLKKASGVPMAMARAAGTAAGVAAGAGGAALRKATSPRKRPASR